MTGVEKLTIYVCIGSACHQRSSYAIMKRLSAMIEENGLTDRVALKSAFCLGHCTEAVSVLIGNEVRSVSSSTVRDFFVTYILPKVAG
jgi:NADH:ubiquinone oxidoreductase subunit E